MPRIRKHLEIAKCQFLGDIDSTPLELTNSILGFSWKIDIQKVIDCITFSESFLTLTHRNIMYLVRIGEGGVESAKEHQS